MAQLGGLPQASSTESVDHFPGLVKSRKRKLGQALGAAITARRFRCETAVSFSSDVNVAVHEAITKASTTVLKGLEEPDWVLVAVTSNHNLEEAMNAVRDIWEKPILHGMTSCQGMAVRAGVSGMRQDETHTLGLYVICDESPDSLYDIVGMPCTNMETFRGEFQVKFSKYYKRHRRTRRDPAWLAKGALWLSSTPMHEELMAEVLEQTLGSDSAHIPFCGGTAGQAEHIFPLSECSTGYALSGMKPVVFTGGTPFDGGAVVSIMHTSCRIKTTFTNYYAPVSWAHGFAELDKEGSICKINGRGASEVYREWITTVEGMDPLPADADPDIDMFAEVLDQTAQRPLAIRVGYSSEHTEDFITVPPFNISKSGIKVANPIPVPCEAQQSLTELARMLMLKQVALDLNRTVMNHVKAENAKNIEVYLMRATDASILRSIRRNKFNNIAGALGAFCAGKMLQIKRSTLGPARWDMINKEIGQSLGGAPYLMPFAFGEHGYIKSRKSSAHGKLMSSFLIFCPETKEDLDVLVSLLIEDPEPHPLDVVGAKEVVEIQEENAPPPGDVANDCPTQLTAYHLASTAGTDHLAKAQSLLQGSEQPAASAAEQPATVSFKEEAGAQAEGVDALVSKKARGEDWEDGAHPHGNLPKTLKRSQSEMRRGSMTNMKEDEQGKREKRSSGELVKVLLSESPTLADLKPQMITDFIDFLGLAVLEETVLSSKVFLRLCFLVEHRLLQLGSDPLNVRKAEWLEMSEQFGRLPRELVDVGERELGMNLTTDLLSLDDKLWTEVPMTPSFQDFLTHPTTRQHVTTMWEAPRPGRTSALSARNLHRMHLVCHAFYLAALVPSLFLSNPIFNGILALYRLATFCDDWYYTQRRYNMAYTYTTLATVGAQITRTVMAIVAPESMNVPSIVIVILEGVTLLRWTIRWEYMGPLQLAILRIGVEFYRFFILVMSLTVVFAMALTVNGHFEGDFRVSERFRSERPVWIPGRHEAGGVEAFFQWVLELLMVVVFGADPRAYMDFSAEEWGGMSRLLAVLILYILFGAFSIVVLLNVLIAMCMSAYEAVTLRREAEWQTLIFELARDYRQRPGVPQGFGLIYRVALENNSVIRGGVCLFPNANKIHQEETDRIAEKRKRGQVRLSLFLDLVCSQRAASESMPKPATMAGLDSLGFQLESLQQVSCSVQDQVHHLSTTVAQLVAGRANLPGHLSSSGNSGSSQPAGSQHSDST